MEGVGVNRDLVCYFGSTVVLFVHIGESGLGKSTLLNSLFLTDLYTPSSYPSIEERMKKTVEVSPCLHSL